MVMNEKYENFTDFFLLKKEIKTVSRLKKIVVDFDSKPIA